MNELGIRVGVGVIVLAARARNGLVRLVRRFHRDDRGDVLQYLIIAVVVLTVGFALMRAFYADIGAAFTSLGQVVRGLFTTAGGTVPPRPGG